MKSQTKKQPNAKARNQQHGNGGSNAAGAAKPAAIRARLEAGETEIRACLDAEATASWTLAEAVTKHHNYIMSCVTCTDRNGAQWRKALMHIIGYSTLSKYWPDKLEINQHYANELMRSLRLRTMLAPTAHIKLSPTGIRSGLAGLKGEEEQLAVLREAVKTAPADGRVGVGTIRKAAKAYLDARKAKEEAEDPNPDSPAMAKVRAIVKPLYAATVVTDKMFIALINGIDLPAIESAVNILADVAERYRGYHESLIEYRDRIQTQSAQPPPKREEAKAEKPKPKRKSAPPPAEEEGEQRKAA